MTHLHDNKIKITMLRNLIILVALIAVSCSTTKETVMPATKNVADMTNEEKADHFAHKYLITDGHVDLPYRLKIQNFRLEKEYLGIPLDTDDGDFDYKYGVDYEVYKSNKLICALQIKPKSYLSHNHYIEKARTANLSKNKAYLEAFGIPVYNVISKLDGTVINKVVLHKLTD